MPTRWFSFFFLAFFFFHVLAILSNWQTTLALPFIHEHIIYEAPDKDPECVERKLPMVGVPFGA